MIKIGDKVRKKVYAGRVCDAPEGFVGTVIDINAPHRHYTVEFDIDGVKLRETYFNWEGIRT